MIVLINKTILTVSHVFLAVGLPLTRFGSEKADFIHYLTARKEVTFYYETVCYTIRIVNAAVLIKVSDNGDDTEEPLLSGAGFTAFLKSSLKVLEKMRKPLSTKKVLLQELSLKYMRRKTFTPMIIS